MITKDLRGSPFSIDDVDDREVVVDDVNVNFDVDVIIDDFLKMLIER